MDNGPIINRVGLLKFFSWITSGFKFFCQAPAKLMLISAVFLTFFFVVFLGSSKFPDSFMMSTIISVLLSLVFPFTLSALAVAAYQYQHEGKVQVKPVLSGVFVGHNLRLIFIYVLFILLVSLGTSYIANIWPGNERITSYVMEAIFVILQLLILVAIPMNINNKGKYKPFHTLLYALKGIVINFVPCILFMLTLFCLLLLAIVIARYTTLVIGSFALAIYVLELTTFHF